MPKSKTFVDRADAAGFIVSEANGRRSREQCVLAAHAADYASGTVIAKLTANGQYTILAPAAATGAEVAAGILFSRKEIAAGTQRAVRMARDCEVNGNLLVWPAGISGPQKAAAETQLAALGIIVRY